jgi:hypothetical protein
MLRLCPAETHRAIALQRHRVKLPARRVMEPIINLQETPGKIAGRRKPPGDAFAAGMALQQLAIELGRSFQQGTVPKGVYRFNSHEEADEWMWKMLARPRKKN